jgi:hypothetical protein
MSVLMPTMCVCVCGGGCGWGSVCVGVGVDVGVGVQVGSYGWQEALDDYDDADWLGVRLYVYYKHYICVFV